MTDFGQIQGVILNFLNGQYLRLNFDLPLKISRYYEGSNVEGEGLGVRVLKPVLLVVL